MVTDFAGEDKASGIKFCIVVQGRPGQIIAHFGDLCSYRSPKSDQSATTEKYCIGCIPCISLPHRKLLSTDAPFVEIGMSRIVWT